MKSAKPLWCLSVVTSLEAEDAVTELLGSTLDCTASSYFNLETRLSRISVYREKEFSSGLREQIAAGLMQIKDCGLVTGPAKISISKVRRQDWAESWKKHFPPLAIADALLVKPSWSKRRPRKGQAVVILDPGLSFGTGQHPTTAFCLAEIVRGCKAGLSRSLLDIGTGSGILAIAAAKLGYQPVRAYDFDPESVRVSLENAKLNEVAARVDIKRADIAKLKTAPGRKFDLVCANLLSDLLIRERVKIASQVSRHGTLALAGILRSEFPAVQKAYAGLGWHLVRARTVKEWRSGSFCLDRKFCSSK